MTLSDCYLPESAGSAVVEMLGLDLRGQMLREEYLLAYDQDEDTLEERLGVLRFALDEEDDSAV